ncbi:MAG: oligopeptide transport system ATP-binding protein [Chloroflexota bacterium]|nr:oligopeptide transport system ATP-binding protein [Chloroflexota bacterium]
MSVNDLVKEFPVRSGLFRQTVDRVRAVNRVSFEIRRGETLGLVGESGSGKSTTARCITRLIEPTSGSISLAGEDVVHAHRARLLELRRKMQMVFQDPYSSLDPRMTVQRNVGEGLAIHKIGNRAERRNRVIELLELTGLGREHLSRFPWEFSGGQRQRIGIARALAVGPDLLVCDEPVSSLDVSIAAQIMNLFKDLQQRLGLTILFIAHDLAMVRHLCDHVAVMLNGELVEIGPASQIYEAPQHAYTKALLLAKSIPDPVVERERRKLRREQLRSVDSTGS